MCTCGSTPHEGGTFLPLQSHGLPCQILVCSCSGDTAIFNKQVVGQYSGSTDKVSVFDQNFLTVPAGFSYGKVMKFIRNETGRCNLIP